MKINNKSLEEVKKLTEREMQELSFEYPYQKQWADQDAYLFVLSKFYPDVVKCSECKKYQWDDGTWKDNPEYKIIKRDTAKGIIGNITETYCPQCIDYRINVEVKNA